MKRKLILAASVPLLVLVALLVFRRSAAPDSASTPATESVATKKGSDLAGPAVLVPPAESASSPEIAAASPAPDASRLYTAALLATSDEFTADGWEVIRYPDEVPGEPLWAGEPVVARVEFEGRRVQLTPNQLGEFPRLNVAAGAGARVRLAFPEGTAASPVIIAPLDGGTVEAGQLSLVRELGTDHAVGFTYKASTYAGVHRVQVRRPGQAPVVLEFWAGQPEIHHLAQR
jgi:hypothetical protein